MLKILSPPGNIPTFHVDFNVQISRPETVRCLQLCCYVVDDVNDARWYGHPRNVEPDEIPKHVTLHSRINPRFPHSKKNLLAVNVNVTIDVVENILQLGQSMWALSL